MANFLANADLGPELVESNLKSVLCPVLQFVGTLNSGDTTTVSLVGDDGGTYGTFVLDTIASPVKSGPITNLPKRIKFVVQSGTGRFSIEAKAGY